MKQRIYIMFKKSLIALALTSFVGAASAATIPQGITSFSAEGVANEATIDANDFGDVVAVSAIVNGYQVGDQLVFTFPNDVLDTSTAATIAVGGTGTPVLGFSTPDYNNGNSVSFTITSVTTAMIVGSTATLDGIILEGANLAGGGTVVADFKVISSVNDSDYETVSEVVANTASQYAVTATGFSGVVDVNETRKLFVADAPTTTTTDTLVVTAVETGLVKDAVETIVAYTLGGDFSFMDTDGDGTADYTVTVDNATDEAIATDFQSITWTASGAASATHTVVITASNAGTPTAIPVQTFTVDSVVTYNTATAGASVSTEETAMSGGEWALNGSSFTVPYMPYGGNTKPILSLTNTGSLAGEVLVSYMTETGSAWVEFDTAGLMSNTGVTNLAGTIDGIVAEIVAADPTATSGKLALQVTVNAPDTAISGYAAFKVVNEAGESRVSIGAYGEHGNRARGTVTGGEGTVK